MMYKVFQSRQSSLLRIIFKVYHQSSQRQKIRCWHCERTLNSSMVFLEKFSMKFFHMRGQSGTGMAARSWPRGPEWVSFESNMRARSAVSIFVYIWLSHVERNN